MGNGEAWRQVGSPKEASHCRQSEETRDCIEHQCCRKGVSDGEEGTSRVQESGGRNCQTAGDFQETCRSDSGGCHATLFCSG